MPLSPGERIGFIREIATLLDKQEWPDIDLVLDQHGLPTTDDWNGGPGKRAYVVAMIQRASDDDLRGLHGFLTGTSGQSMPGASPFKSDRLRLFLSHLTSHRDLVGEVGRVLGVYGIDAFVAHDSITPSKEWQQVIEAGLSECDALVVFFHKGFLESVWCDQEVGWVMGRSRPILPLAFDVMPHGFVSKLQAKKCADLKQHQVAPAVIDWLVSQPTLHPRLAASLTSSFVDSGSWDQTRRLSRLMEQVRGFTDDQLEAMGAAAESNVDVRACDVFGTPGPEWVAKFVAERRMPSPAVASTVWPTAF
ncbi:hypothetical protein C5C52_07925 [Rathayibacter sp. AY1E5]|uniref:toll/interleukin-1 receptor domain-containing protein n=1 Tax=Rathayibacter sp. AY1E5 TaxID=2080553 RepID=UPI000CE73B36|nr:toll/interleukin-1 receptor domain-containing protein [Rathayibacter sp. AY1E5]PPG81738.1 hypothetical protein C5C52_07925 [Rathayibacter sp. AY1E5]